MPITKTAKRALRGSKRKERVNNFLKTRLEVALRKAKKTKSKDKILDAISLADKATKRHIIHKNKASRIKSALSRLSPKIASQKSGKKSRQVPKK